MDRARTPRPSDRCQRIIDLIDSCLAEHGTATAVVIDQRRPATRRHR